MKFKYIKEQLFIVLLCVGFGGLLGSMSSGRPAHAQGTNPTIAQSSFQSNISVSSDTQVIAHDGTNVNWCVHVDYNVTTADGIRCESGLWNGTGPGVTPTSSVGYEISPGSTLCSNQLPNNPAVLSLFCSAEAGSPAVSVWVDHH